MLKRMGAVGAIIAGLACFTPLFAVALGAMGLGWLTRYADYILVPILFLFLGITFYARQREKPSNNIVKL